MPNTVPPRLAERLLRAVLPGGIRGEMIVADLREEFAERIESFGKATGWYLRIGAGIALNYLTKRPRGIYRLDPEGPGLATPPPPTRWRVTMGSFAHDVRYAARALVKRPALTAIVVATLALAIGVNTAVFSLVDYMLFRPLPIDRPEQVVRIYTSDYSSGPFGGTSYPDFTSLSGGIPALEHSAAYDATFGVSVASGDGSLRLQAGLVSGEFFNLLGVRPDRGRLIAPSDEQAVGGDAVVVLSHSVWQSTFGSAPDIVGRTLSINGEPHMVIGVTESSYTGIDIGNQPDLWLPMTMYGVVMPGLDAPNLLDERGARWVLQIGRVREGSTIEQVAAQANAVMVSLAGQYPETNRGISGDPEAPRPMTVLPIADQAGTRGQITDRAVFLTGIMTLVLLIACANVANILVAQGRRRRREFAVRLALGANRWQLSRQVLLESALLALVGGVSGLAVAVGLSRVIIPLGLPSVLQGSLTLDEVPLDWMVMLFALGLSGVTGVLFGILPALDASRPDLVPALKAHAEPVRSKGRRWNMRDGLVVLQVSASMVLVLGAGLFVRAIISAYDTQLGFEPAGVAIATLDAGSERMSTEQGVAFHGDLLERVRHLPGVESAALALYVPVQAGGGRRGYRVEDLDPEAVDAAGIRRNPLGFAELNLNIVSDGYFSTLGIGLLQGRVFDESDDATAQRVVVVNRTFAETFWPGRSAIGKQIQSGRDEDPPMTVIGVVETGKYRDLREDPLPYLYVPMRQEYRSVAVLAVRSDGPAEAMLPQLAEVVRTLRPGMPLLATNTLQAHLGDSLNRERTTMNLVVALGVLALVVAAIGLYGLLAYSVATRRREIGIRNALGARSSTLVNMVLGQGMKLVVLGVVVGAVSAVGLSRLLSATVVGVAALDPLTLSATAGLLVLVALVASYLPARRAARVDPVAALRAD